jgi:hypothetical protein
MSRDAARRLRHAGDVRLELDELTSSATSSADLPAPTTRSSRLTYVPWAITAVA